LVSLGIFLSLSCSKLSLERSFLKNVPLSHSLCFISLQFKVFYFRFWFLFFISYSVSCGNSFRTL
jgi:hypothetical protein